MGDDARSGEHLLPVLPESCEFVEVQSALARLLGDPS